LVLFEPGKGWVEYLTCLVSLTAHGTVWSEMAFQGRLNWWRGSFTSVVGQFQKSDKLLWIPENKQSWLLTAVTLLVYDRWF